MPTLISRSGNSSRKPTEVARADRVVADRDDALVLAGQRDQLVGEGLAAVEGRRVGGGWRSSRPAPRARPATCSAVGTLWCHSTRSSMKDTPLPLIVLAMTRDGLARWSTARTPRAARAWSWPSTLADLPAEAASTCRRAARAAWCPRCGRPAAAGCGRRSRSGWPGRSGRRSSPPPSCCPPAARRRRARRTCGRPSPRSLAASAQPTATGKPWPSGPVLVSTPGHLGPVGVAVERRQRLRMKVSSSLGGKKPQCGQGRVERAGAVALAQDEAVALGRGRVAPDRRRARAP